MFRNVWKYILWFCFRRRTDRRLSGWLCFLFGIIFRRQVASESKRIKINHIYIFNELERVLKKKKLLTWLAAALKGFSGKWTAGKTLSEAFLSLHLKKLHQHTHRKALSRKLSEKPYNYMNFHESFSESFSTYRWRFEKAPESFYHLPSSIW